MASRLTVIRTRLSAWNCQPFCCQRTLNPIPSECHTFREACLVGLTESLTANLAFQLNFLAKVSQKIKNPASSAGHNRHYFATLRETRQDLPGAARKVPHSRILRLPYRSDRDSPDWPTDFGKSPNRESVYLKPSIRQVLVKTFFC
jgi:hypothetical protein